MLCNFILLLSIYIHVYGVALCYRCKAQYVGNLPAWQKFELSEGFFLDKSTCPKKYLCLKLSHCFWKLGT